MGAYRVEWNMLRQFTAVLTALAVLTHGAVGCCTHHGHGELAAAGAAGAARDTSCCQAHHGSDPQAMGALDAQGAAPDAQATAPDAQASVPDVQAVSSDPHAFAFDAPAALGVQLEWAAHSQSGRCERSACKAVSGDRDGKLADPGDCGPVYGWAADHLFDRDPEYPAAEPWGPAFVGEGPDLRSRLQVWRL